MVDFNEAFDDMNEHRRYSRVGFTKGYAMGEEVGWREGFLFGLKKGASLATEIGFYQGYTSAWLTLLEKQDQGKARKVQALKSLLDMARTFPLEEQLLSGSSGGVMPDQSQVPGSSGGSFAPRLSKIRAKFRQVQGLLLDQKSGLPSSSSSSSAGPAAAAATTTTTSTANSLNANNNNHHHHHTGHQSVPQPQLSSHHLHPHAVPNSASATHQQRLRPPPPHASGAGGVHLYQNWVSGGNRSPSGFASGSFESRTSSQTETGGGGLPTEMSF